MRHTLARVWSLLVRAQRSSLQLFQLVLDAYPAHAREPVAETRTLRLELLPQRYAF